MFKGKCCGNYKNVLVIVNDSSALDSVALLPSTVLKKVFNTFTFLFSDDDVHSAAAKAMLSPSDARIWLEHLHTVMINRKCGAAKVAATRRAKITASNSGISVLKYHCEKCGKEFEEETESLELRICCDLCDTWYSL